MLTKRNVMRAFGLGLCLAWVAQAGQTVQFVFTSDPHFGINRSVFHGEKNVDARYANAEMVAKINTLPGLNFPEDGELRAGQPIGSFDFVAVGGDIANRMEAATIIQSAKKSWQEFEKIYLNGLQVKNAAGQPAPVLVIPGNHDATNALGFYKRLDPKTDPTSMVEIYNRMMRPAQPLTAETFDYTAHKVHYSRDIGGLHLAFTQIWPDSAELAWLEQDLSRLPKGTPVLLFTHDEPEVEAKHFVNPNGDHGINKKDKFENLLTETFKGGGKSDDKSTVHERRLATFVKEHPEIKAYFHGNSHMPDLKVWMGPDADFMLPAFSVDSPVKGEQSGKKEELLSFQVATVDLDAKQITVRECLWNADPEHVDGPLAWGNRATFDFRMAPVAEPVVAPVVMPVASPVVEEQPAPVPEAATMPVAP